jgi:signal transduction histidine kinase
MGGANAVGGPSDFLVFGLFSIPSVCALRRPACSTARCGVRALLRPLVAAIGVVIAAAGSCPDASCAEGLRGLPFTRAYPLEELGYVPRGVRLSFDPLGRLVVIHDEVYAVLNDTEWVDLADKTPIRGINMTNVARGQDGRTYFAGRGSWGRVEGLTTDELQLVPLTPPNRPKWTNSTSFSDIVSTSKGMVFGGFNGIALLDYERGESRYVEASGVAKVFRLQDRVFVSCHGSPLQELDFERATLRPLPGANFSRVGADATAPLDDGRVLIYCRDGRLVVFDGETATPWPAQERYDLTGMVTAIERRVEGGIAVAITGKGLFLVSPEGEMTAAITTPEYHRINALASGEPGVLWAATEDAIVKVLHGSPVTVFGQRLGLPASWPAVLRWNGRVCVSSSGRLYEVVPGTQGMPARFERMKVAPENGAWATATHGEDLLIGNASGVMQVNQEGRMSRVMGMDDVAHLVMAEADRCYVIGRKEVAFLKFENGSWHEAAPRIRGVGNPVVAHAAGRSAWIELGANRVARLTERQGQLHLREINDLPWLETQWVNVGVVGHTVVLSGAVGGRYFFDEQTETWSEAPWLENLLSRSPYWITRVKRDAAGVLWGSHRQGVVTFTPHEGDYVVDASTFDLIGDQFPMVHILEGNDVWFAGGRSLFHVDENRSFPVAKPPAPPVLVSASNGRTQAPLDLEPMLAGQTVPLPFDQNSLNFRFFSGSYAWRRPPQFEYRLDETENWTPLPAGEVLRLSTLREGNHTLEVRLKSSEEAKPLRLNIASLPPWHRTWTAYSLYGFGLLASVAGIVIWTHRRGSRRNLALEKLVRERTRQLEAAMEKLNEETRNAATFAERNRIAGEIHDSLQQGLTGLMLQIDATLKIGDMPEDLRSRLNVARNMVSFTRHEVQHAVWDLETPLLKDAELGEALQKLVALISSGEPPIEVVVHGPSRPLPSTIKHHLLRIAQEAVTNAVRHAAAKQISLRLHYSADGVHLEVADDGRGFDAHQVISQVAGHFGLRGLQERAAKMHALLNVHSARGQGTRIQVVVPTSSLSS